MATTSSQLRALSGVNAIDALTNGTSWTLGADRTITWAVANAGPGDFAWNSFTSTAMAIDVANALAAYSEVANVRFAYQGWYADVRATPADIVVTATAYPALFGMTPSTYARAYFPSEYLSDGEITRLFGSSSVYPNASGDVALNFTNFEMVASDYSLGSNGFFALLHELGHAMGLKHPHDNGGTSGHPTFQQLGVSPADTQRLTIMSYDPASSLAVWFQAFGLPVGAGYPQSLMPLDVIALQSIYGPNTSTRAGNTTYTLTNDNVIATYWDASGRDLLTAEGSGLGWRIESVAVPDGSTLTLALPFDWTGITGKWYFNIEDATGSNWADWLAGTAVPNVLKGLGGNDRLTGLGGDDSIDGGAGLDTSAYSGARSNYTVTRTNTGWNVSDRTGAEGRDSLTNIERLVFADISLAVDTFPGGHAVQAAQILRAIIAPAALTNREVVGVVINMLDQGISYDGVVSTAIDAMKSIGMFQTNRAFVDLVYQNVVGFRPTEEAAAGFVAMLDSGKTTMTQLGVLAATTDVNTQSADLVGIAANGIEFVVPTGL